MVAMGQIPPTKRRSGPASLGDVLHLRIPISIIKVWRGGQKSLSVLRTFSILKKEYGGKVRFDQLDQAAGLIGISRRTLDRHLDILEEAKYVGINKERSLVHLRSWNFIGRLVKVSVVKKVEVDSEDFTASVIAGILAYLLSFHGDKSVLQRVRAGLKSIQSSPHRGGISCQLLADFLGISKTSAWRLRKQCKDHGYIKLRARWKDTGIPADQWRFLKMAGIDPRLKLRKGTLQERVTDRIIFV